MMTLTKVFERTLDAYQDGRYNIISNMGGTRSGKTFSVLQLLYFILIGNSDNLLISVVSRTMPHLKRGVIRDWNIILDQSGRAGLVDINKTDNIYTFQHGNRIEFFSADDTGKLHGAARNILFINECNYIEEEKVKQLFVRTTGMKFLDYNPSAPFWIDEYKDRDDFIEFHSTYKDNKFLTEEQVREIESNKKNKRWWSIYGEGKEYVKEGLAYPRIFWETDYKWTDPSYGLDFGYHDPTACVKVEIKGNKIYVGQVFYKKGLDVSGIKKELESEVRKKKDLLICDSAEPQIIQELKNDGWVVKPCVKGKNSVFEGVQLLNGYEIHCVGERTELGKEFKTYSYEQDMDGNFTDILEDRNNHAMDAMRYVVTHLRGKKTGTYSYSFV